MAINSSRSRTIVPLVAAVCVVLIVVLVTFAMRARHASDQNTDTVVAVDTDSAAAGSTTLRNAAGRGAGRALPRSPQEAQLAAREVMQKRKAMRQQSKEKSEVLRKKIAAQFDAEKVDPSWSSGKELDLKKISSLPQISSAVVAPKSMNVDCRSSMCRIDSSFATNGEAEDWTMLYMASVGSAMPNAVVTHTQNPDGTSSVRIYGRGR